MCNIDENMVWVVFRKFPEGDVIALFPEIEDGPGLVLSYQHIGQHGSASVDLLSELEPATTNECAELMLELEQLGYRQNPSKEDLL